MASAVVRLESSPPERYVPTGTSARRRSSTLERMIGSRSPASSVRGRVVRLPPGPLGDDPAALPDDAARPGGSMFTPRNAVRGARGAHVVKTSSMPPRSGAAETSPEANSALASEPKTIVPSSSSVQCSGWMPKRSRTSVRRRGPGSHQANANWPFSWSSAARPSRSSSRSTTSVSLVVSEVDPVTRELGPQLGVVEDLAVVDDERPAGRRDCIGCQPWCDVEDGQTGGREAGALTERQPEPVGPAVADRPRHPAQGDLLHRPRAIRAHDAGDAAHVSRPRPARS